MQLSKSSSKLMKLVVIALLATVSLVLFFISFPLPLLPPYLKVDFSDVPALLAGIIFSPLAGILVLLLKNLLYFVATGATDPIGVVANFIAGSVFILPVLYMYSKHKTIKSIVVGLVIGTVVMVAVMSVLNYYVVLPAYSWLMGYGAETASAKFMAVVAGILPFNFIKGIIISLLFVPLFMKLHDWIEQKRTQLAK